MIEIITSKTRKKLLTLFLTNPDTKFHMRDLARKSGEYINSVRLELNKLEAAGIINSEKVANLKYYSTNKKCSIYPELRGLILKTDPAAILINQVLGSLKLKFKKNLSSVILFGSLAKNNLNFNDIDLLVVVKELKEDWRKKDDIIIGLEKEGLNFGIALHIELLTEKELEFSVAQGAPLLLEISIASKIIHDNGSFKKQINILKENMLRWKAKKTNNIWEVPELAVKV